MCVPEAISLSWFNFIQGLCDCSAFNSDGSNSFINTIIKIINIKLVGSRFLGVQHLLYNGQPHQAGGRDRRWLHSRIALVRLSARNFTDRDSQASWLASCRQKLTERSKLVRRSEASVQHQTDGAQADGKLHVRLSRFLVLKVLRQAARCTHHLPWQRDLASGLDLPFLLVELRQPDYFTDYVLVRAVEICWYFQEQGYLS